MLKRIIFFLLTNLAVLVTFNIILAVMGGMFGVRIDPNTYGGLLFFCLIYGLLGSFVSLWLSKWTALHLTDGRVISTPQTEEERWLLSVVERLAKEWGYKTPQLAIYQSPQPNAFATGPTRNRSLIAVSSGLLQMMNRDEIEGVIGHEMSHVGNGDMVTMALIQGVLNAFVYVIARAVGRLLSERLDLGALGYWICFVVLQITFTLLANIVVLYYSRRREYAADAGSARHVGVGKMIAALQKLRYPISTETRLPEAMNSFGIRENDEKTSIWATHPSIDSRIAALRKMV